MNKILKPVYLWSRSLLLACAGLLIKGSVPAGYVPAPRKLLFIRIDRLGDMVMSTPVLRAIKARSPSVRLTVLASAVNAPLLAGNPFVDEVIVWNPGRTWLGALVCLRHLHAAGFDAVIDPLPEYDLETALIAFFSGASYRLGYDIAGRGALFSVAVRPPDQALHFIEETFYLVKAMGIEQRGEKPELFSTPGAETAAARILEESGVGALPLIAVHPGGHYASQRWPAERFAAVVAWLLIKYKAAVLLIGSASEGGPLAVIELAVSAGRGQKCVVKAVDLPADVLAALLRRCVLFVGNNSGPLHMAGALGVPAVSTMGPTDPVRWSPRGAGQAVLKAPSARLDAISAEEMIVAAEKLLDKGL